jgi:hypothetical protein
MKPIVLVSLLALCLPLGTAAAQTKLFKGNMAGTAEVPAVSTAARGVFNARISDDGAAIHYQLAYTGLEGDVSMAHIHLGQRSVNGGIAVWLCSNLGTPGVQPCPAPPATISGIVTAADIVGPASQGLVAGEFAELVRAVRNGTAYANVHSSKFPGGEIRAQLDPGTP